MTTMYFDYQTRTRKPDADRLLDEPQAAAGASTQPRRDEAGEIPRPGVCVHRQRPGMPWVVAYANPGGDHGVRPTENGVAVSTPGRCSCGRRPVQWLDGAQGPKTVPYCGRPLGNHHGSEVEAAVWETPESIESAAGDADWLDDESLNDDPEPITLSSLAGGGRR